MLRSSRKSLLVVLLYCAISIRYAEIQAKEHEALIFTRDVPRLVYDIVKLAKNGYPRVVSPTALACPSEFPQEQAFNDRHSLGKHSLFVRNTHEPRTSSKDFNYQICDTPYKMSVVYHTIAVEFQFGFEIYYDKSKFGNKNFVHSKKWHYDLITNTRLKKNYIKPILSKVPSMPAALGNLIPTPVTSTVSRILQDNKMSLDDQTELGFMWLCAFHLKFNFRSKRLAQATYNLSQTTRGVYECDDWNLGMEYFTGVGIQIDELYSKDNQVKMLKGVKIPTSKPQDKNENTEDASCEPENECFVKWSALPAQQFHFLAAKPTSCSYLLAAPIWKSTIENVLKKLDNFLYTVSKVIGHPIGQIGIHSGVHGDLRLPIDSDTKRSLKTITLADNDIPVPNIIYKLVKYKPTICKKEINEINEPEHDRNNGKLKDNNEKNEPKHDLKNNDEKYEPKENVEIEETRKPSCDSVQAALIVVIHNNPSFDPETEKICDDMCSRWGWEEIQFREVAGKRIKSKYIYCCYASDVEVRKKLGINNDEYGVKSLDFSLKFVLLPISDTMSFEAYDLSDVVATDYKKLFEEGEHESDENDNNEEELATMKLDQTNAESYEIQEPERGNDEPEKSETELVDDEKILEGLSPETIPK